MADSIFDFRLPDVGEGLEEAEIVQWKVSVGQKIEANQTMVEIESSKSLVELPSPYAGIVLEILEPEGKVVLVGTPIIRITVAESKPSADNELVTARIEMLVGSGPRTEENSGRPRKQRNYGRTESVITGSLTPEPTKPATPGLANPLVRKLARELAVDISTLIGSGPEGSVTREDVQRSAGAVSGASKVITRHFEPRTECAREVRTPIRGVQKAMAEAMVASAFSAPHVTEFITVDVTASMNMLERFRQQPDFAGIRLSPLTLLARAMCVAAWQTPQINSFWDEGSREIVTKNYVNLGIATATERGLIVPNIKDADQLSFKELASAIAQLVEVARAGKTEPKALTGGTMSITNIGVFGIDSGTPILPPGESAIIAFGAVAQRPWVVGGEIVVRQITTLALSFDHRLVDGAQGSKFLSDVALILQEPAHIAWV
jgi:pyruvate dehydrogenase E2 component (dihydrolipoamide acetyltransferase)